MLTILKRKRITRLLSVFLGALLLISCFSISENIKAADPSNGQLKVVGNQLCNNGGKAVQLKGMSSHGLQWYGQYMNKSSIRFMKSSWGANVVRAAMYTGENGYISNPASMKAKVKEVVDAAIENGMYVIIDWHILSDGNPNTYKEQAKSFFSEMSKTYGKYPNVIYEICNEPNGNVNWNKDIKPYAEYVIPAIRANDPDNIIIVGTGTWSQDVNDAADNPLSGSNLMYACHFYAGTHTQFLRDKINYAMSKGCAIFVTEWGTSDASGNGGTFLEESQKWIDFMDSKKISWTNWSLCDKGESSAALKAGASTDGGWTDSNLTDSGKFVKRNMNTGSTGTTTAPVATQAPSATKAPVATTKPTTTNKPVATSTPVATAKPVTNGKISIKYDISNNWGSGALANVTITNNTSSAINGWNASFGLTGNQKVAHMWNASYTGKTTELSIKSMDYNKSIPANGGTQTFGFIINGTATKPSSMKINGIGCTIE